MFTWDRASAGYRKTLRLQKRELEQLGRKCVVEEATQAYTLQEATHGEGHGMSLDSIA